MGEKNNITVSCVNGNFTGRIKNSVASFLGIPFAKPPVGELRWKNPVPVEESEDTFEAFDYAPSPLQSYLESERASGREQSEDCLYLNIWANENTMSEKKPVMVFIHGGSYGWGGTGDPLYDGQNFIQAHPDVVLVTIAYRVGFMGFLDLSIVPGGEEYKTSGNLGLLDQICALRYIKENIAGFGGDPECVTVFGESAGGGSVSLLPLIPEARGLFRRVIAESGSVSLTYNKKECRPLTEKLLEITGADDMDDLLALSSGELEELCEKLSDYLIFPERDGVVIPTDLYEAYRRGEASGVDMLIGTNADEMRYWIADIGSFRRYLFMCDYLYENNMKRVTSSDRKRVEAFMRLQENTGRLAKEWNITELYNELLFRLPAIRQADAHSQNGGKTYMYYWKYPSGIKRLGACHAVELAYVFNNPDEKIYAGNNIDLKLAAKTQQMWVNFAKKGDPSVPESEPGAGDGIVWERYDSIDRATMILDKEISQESDIKHLQRELLDPLLDYGFNGSYNDLTPKVPVVGKAVGITIAVFGIAAGLGFVTYNLIKNKEK